MSAHQGADLKKVVLHDRHVAAGGRMVPFGGYELPVQYEGIIAEHKWTRAHAGLFDVSHMGPCYLRLADLSGDADQDHAAISAIIEPLICGDIAGLKPGQIRYTMLLNEQGGVLDDLMVARSPHHPGTLYIVVNAATKEQDFALFKSAAGDKADLVRADDGALLALQGPKASDVLEALLPETAQLGFMHYAPFEWQGARLMIARSGYTGEDGFEILARPEHAQMLWDALAKDERVRPIGLGARDSLRLEAGLPLYGHDLDQATSPIEAGMGFAISRRRRELADFPGAQRILAERQGGLTRKRVGLFIAGAPAREGAEITDAHGNKIGIVTSGGFSPSLGRAIALAFVPPQFAAIGTQLQAIVRGRAQAAVVVDTPFIPHNYFRKPA